MASKRVVCLGLVAVFLAPLLSGCFGVEESPFVEQKAYLAV